MKEVVLYFGKGVDSLSGLHCYKALKQLLPTYVIKRIKTHQFDQIDFAKCALFAMPGGRDVFYQKALYPEKANQLKRYVEAGGSYLGICAGAYFGSRIIEFEKGESLEIIEDRPLQFFPGKAIGSALGMGKFEYNGYRGADIATVQVKEQIHSYFFNGGCFFEHAHSFSNTTIIATYQHNTQPAVIHCKAGQGNAILSGVHFEYLPHLLTTSHLPLAKLALLKKAFSLQLMQDCLKSLVDIN